SGAVSIATHRGRQARRAQLRASATQKLRRRCSRGGEVRPSLGELQPRPERALDAGSVGRIGAVEVQELAIAGPRQYRCQPGRNPGAYVVLPCYGDAVRHRESAVGPKDLRVPDTVRNPFAIEVVRLFNQTAALPQQRLSPARAQPVLIVGD